MTRKEKSKYYKKKVRYGGVWLKREQFYVKIKNNWLDYGNKMGIKEMREKNWKK